jgi:hypothetical protein
MALLAAAACLGVVGDILDGLEAVFPHRALDLPVRDPEALANDLTFDDLVGLSQVAGDGFFQCLAAHHRAVHLLLRQTPQVAGDVVVGDLGR